MAKVILTVMVDVLCGNGGSSSSRVSGLCYSLSVLELLKLSLDTCFSLSSVVVLELALNLRDKVVSVPLWQHLLGCYGLDSSVVVVLVNFSVDGLLGLLMSVWLDDL